MISFLNECIAHINDDNPPDKQELLAQLNEKKKYIEQLVKVFPFL